ncbi:hypothetical protein Rhe02_05810 [Rhizocola hellebori]|uniref:AAA+ ATPase domain-containing protein n=2 Tax=Rhizocola hellebori TaxID=1392758 RepID=A0A8J3VCF9_9ACTN|nr:hypothetical protein Rhe02_05810 [Rhizocola hellebori]
MPSPRVLIAAVLAGAIAASTFVLGLDDPNAKQVWESILIGIGTLFATLLLEEVVRAAVNQLSRPEAGPIATTPGEGIRKGASVSRWDRHRMRALTSRLGRRLRDIRRLRWVVRPEIAPLPGQQAVLRQRPQVIEELYSVHEKLSSQRPSHRFSRLSHRRREQIAGSRPLIIFVQGKPGCGKSEVVCAVAHQVLDRYSGGVVYIDTRTVGAAKPASEVLKTCLEALKWPEREIPPLPADRLKLMRSLTAHRRILFVFDDVRHQNYLWEILPIGSGCTVFVTSDRDLGVRMPGTACYELAEPDIDEGLDILRAAAQLPEETRSEAAAEIVHFCGRLPLALRSAGERVAAGADLNDIADMLRDERTRLDLLDTENRKVKDRIFSEYRRLLPAERAALQWLTLVPSSSFQARALHLLSQVRPEEAENTLAYLAEVRMLDVIDTPRTPSAVRYRFNPLVRLLAQQDFQVPKVERRKALEFWDNDLLKTIEERLVDHDSDSVDHPAASWLDIIRAEYPSVLRVIRLASATQRWATCWKIAARAGGCVVGGVDIAQALAALELGVQAAQRDNSPLGEADTLLAKASMLIEVERYQEGFAVLDRVARLADSMLAKLADKKTPWQVRHCVVHRKRAEAYLQAAAYDQAGSSLAYALTWACEANDPAEKRLLKILRAELHHIAMTPLPSEELSDERLDDMSRYRYHLIQSELERRQLNWSSAGQPLLKELRLSDGDLRRVASLNYRLARLCLHQRTAESPLYGTPEDSATREEPQVGKELVRQAIRRATDALLAFKQIDDTAGIIRSRCLLARALTAAKLYVEAQLACDQAADEVSRRIDRADIAYLPLRARILRARGELRLRRGDLSGGFRELLTASMLFSQTCDWTSQTNVNKLLEANAERHSGDWGTAMPSRHSRIEGPPADRTAEIAWQDELIAQTDSLPAPRESKRPAGRRPNPHG